MRFFQSPLDGPDVPWSSVDDLHVCLRFSRELRRSLKASLQRSWSGNVRTVGLVTGHLSTQDKIAFLATAYHRGGGL